MDKSETLEVLGYSVYTSSLSDIDIHSKYFINTLNQYSYIVSEKHPEFKAALLSSDILLPDGIGIVAAARFLKGKKIKKIAGADLQQYLLEQLDSVGGRCFYLGSSDETLARIESRLTKEYPNINAGFYSPPFKHHFSEIDNSYMIDMINSFKPDVLFIGMTAPKQERWANAHRSELNANIICSIGAAFDFYAGTIKRPGKFWIGIGLEWFIRLLSEPKHLWKRYLYYGPVFIYRILQRKFFPAK